MMRALVCVEPGVLSLEERSLPAAPGPDQVRLAIEQVGICGTDYHILAGRQPYLSYPRVMGHEIAARVLQGNGHVAEGARVIVNPYLACGACHACTRGKPNCCMNIRVLGVHADGAMCEEIVLPAGNVIAADGLSADQAASVEFLAIGAHAVARSAIAMPGPVAALVIGAGPIGLATALFARIAGHHVTLMDLDSGRLAMLGERFGLTDVIAGGEGAADRVRAATGGDGFDLVFDATGSAASMEQAIAFVAHGGSLVYVGLVRDALSLADPEVHKREMTIIRSRNALASDFAHVVHALSTGLIDAGAMITHRVTLAEMVTAMPALGRDRSGLIKAMVRIG